MISEIVDGNNANFANGREMRNLFERTVEAQALRIRSAKDSASLSALQPQDLLIAQTKASENSCYRDGVSEGVTIHNYVENT